jgi:hypothetical protein
MIDIKNGNLQKIIVEDVTVVKNTKIVRRKQREYDLKYTACITVDDLNKYSRRYNSDVLQYLSLKDDIDIEKMKDMAIEIITIEQEELTKQIIEKQKIIGKILKEEV